MVYLLCIGVNFSVVNDSRSDDSLPGGFLVSVSVPTSWSSVTCAEMSSSVWWASVVMSSTCSIVMRSWGTSIVWSWAAKATGCSPGASGSIGVIISTEPVTERWAGIMSRLLSEVYFSVVSVWGGRGRGAWAKYKIVSASQTTENFSILGEIA